jgi:hypothetical protein
VYSGIRKHYTTFYQNRTIQTTNAQESSTYSMILSLYVPSTSHTVTAGATVQRKLECSTEYYDVKGSEEEKEAQQC